MLPHEVPDRPWNKVTVDLFQFRNKNFSSLSISAVDFITFKHADNSCQCGNSSSQVSIWPSRDPTYCRIKQRSPVCLWWIQDLCSCFEFHHVTSSPHHPKSNSRVEAAVKAYKSLIKKTEESGVDVLLALLQAVAKRLRHCIENSLLLPKTHLPLHKKVSTPLPPLPPFSMLMLFSLNGKCRGGTLILL